MYMWFWIYEMQFLFQFALLSIEMFKNTNLTNLSFFSVLAILMYTIQTIFKQYMMDKKPAFSLSSLFIVLGTVGN